MVGVHDSKIIGCSRRNSMEGSTGLKSKTRGRRYLSGRNPDTGIRMATAFDHCGPELDAIERAVCPLEPPCDDETDQGAV